MLGECQCLSCSRVGKGVVVGPRGVECGVGVGKVVGAAACRCFFVKRPGLRSLLAHLPPVKNNCERMCSFYFDFQFSVPVQV